MRKRLIRFTGLVLLTGLTLAQAEPAARTVERRESSLQSRKDAGSAGPSQVGVYNEGRWRLDFDGSGDFSVVGDRDFALGFPGAQRFVADWNGDGLDEVGVFANGFWFIDFDGNGAWDGGVQDLLVAFGWAGATPVVGDWNGDGADELGLYANGFWFLDFDGDFVWDGGVNDRLFPFGWAGAEPLVGDWDGDGSDSVGVYSQGFWFLDYDGDALWDGGTVDRVFGWGWPGVTLVVGDWDGDGRDQAGVYSNGFWFLDQDGDAAWDGGVVDRIVPLGWPGAEPVVGDWNGDGSDKVGVFSSGNWFLDRNGSGAWEPGLDSVYSFGAVGESPVVGRWARNTVSGQIQMDPSDGTQGVPTDRSMILTLPQPVDPSTVSGQTVELLLGGAPVAAMRRVSADGRFLSIRGVQPLAGSTEYEVRVEGLVTQLGQTFEGMFSARFTTGSAPVSGGLAPRSDQSRRNVPTNLQTLFVDFQFPIDPTSFRKDGQYLIGLVTGLRTELDCKLDAPWTVMECTPADLLGVGSRHKMYSEGLSSVYTHAVPNAAQFLMELTTAFLPDLNGAPRVVGIRPPDGSVAVERGASIEILFDDFVGYPDGEVELRSGGQVLPISVSENSFEKRNGTTWTVRPDGAGLQPSTTYTLTVSGARNLAGVAMQGSVSSRFTIAGTGSLPGNVVVSPGRAPRVVVVPRNALFEITFDFPLTAQSWSPGKVRFEGATADAPILATLSPDRRKITVRPAGLFDADASYEIWLGPGLFDVNGRRFSNQIETFTTSAEVDVDPPSITGVIPPHNAVDVVLNPSIRVGFSEVLVWPTSGPNPFRLTTVAGVAVPVNLRGFFPPSFGVGGMILDLAGPLAANTAYRIQIAGLRDLAGNAAPAYSAIFQTGVRTAAYGERPALVQITPSPGTTLSSLSPVFTAFFDQPVALLPGSTSPVTLSSRSIDIPIDFSIQNGGTEVRATPVQPLQPGATYELDFGTSGGVLYGYGTGAAWPSGSYSFLTPGSPAADTTAPQVIGITPSLGAVLPAESGFFTIPVEVTFSEPVDPETVNDESAFVSIDGREPGLFRGEFSPDGRTLSTLLRLSGGRPFFGPDKDTAQITVILTRQIEDLSGNGLAADFISTFQLQADSSSNYYDLRVHEVRPNPQARNVPASALIDLLMTSPFATQNLDQTFYIAENGRLIAGSFAAMANDRVVRFTPNQPFQPGAVVQIFSRNTLTTPDGERTLWYRDTSFSVAGRQPTVFQVISPLPSRNVPSNAVFTVRFNDTVNPSTLDADSVQIYDYATAGPLPATLEILPGGDVVQLTLLQPLQSQLSYELRLTPALQSQAGLFLEAAVQARFQADSSADVDVPSALALSPPPGSRDVPLNAPVRIRFSEAMNVDTIPPGAFRIESGGRALPAHDYSLAVGGRTVNLLPLATLDPNAVYTVYFSGAQDPAGHTAPPVSWTFQTGDSIDTTDPLPDPALRSPNPLPAGEPFRLFFDEPIDPASIDPAFVSGFPGPVDITFQNGGKLLVFTPRQPLPVGRQFRLYISSSPQDLAGNSYGSANFSFTTGFSPDTTPPFVQTASVADGSTRISPFFEVTIELSEAIDIRSVTDANVRVLLGATPAPLFFQLEPGLTTLVLRAKSPLALNSTYTVELRNLLDLSGNAMIAPYRIEFATQRSFDTIGPDFESNMGGARDLYRNVAAKLRFSERLDPASMRPDTIFYSIDGSPLPGTPTLDASGRRVVLTPDVPLPANSSVSVVVTQGVQDVGGNGRRTYVRSVSFTTSAELVDVTAPVVSALMPADGATNVPRWANVTPLLSESLDPWATPVFSTRLIAPGGATAVRKPLLPNTTYRVEGRGGADFAGHALAPVTGTLTTGWALDNTTTPFVVASNPASGSTGAPLDSVITVDFDQPVLSTYVFLRLNVGVAGVPVRWSTSPDFRRLTIVPLVPLLPDRRYLVSFNGRNIVGTDLRPNGASPAFFLFTTTATPPTPDPTPPTVLSVDPPDGALDVADPTVTLTFSEPLRSTSLDGIGLFFEGSSHPASISLVGDGSTAVVSASIVSNLSGQFAVVVTDVLEDLAGNGAVPFLSRFTYTDPDLSGGGATFNAKVRPTSGARNVALDAAVHFFFNGPLDPTSLPGAVLVSENGVVITGSTTLHSGDQVLTFTPDVPYAANANIEAFLDFGALLTASGLPPGSYVSRTRFTTAPQGPPAGPLKVTAQSSPGWPFPLDGQILFRFNKPIDAATLDANSVVVTFGGVPLSMTLSLERGGLLLRVAPNAPLPPDSNGSVRLKSALRAVDGETFINDRDYSVNLRTTSTTVGVLPTAVISPPDGATGVGVNAEIVVRFSGPINRVTVDESTIRWTNASGVGVPCTFSFSQSGDVVTVVPHDPFDPLSDYTVTVDGVEDHAGRQTPVASITFTAAAEPDFVRPRLTRFSPEEFGAPRNTAVVLQFDEFLDPNTINSASMRLLAQDGQFPDNQVLGAAALESDSKTVVFLPDELLDGDRKYQLVIDGAIRDLSGNGITFLQNQRTYFGVDNRIESGPPSVAVSLPANASSGAAISSKIAVVFDRPIRPDSVDPALVRIERGGVAVPAILEVGGGGRAVLLRPTGLFNPSTTYTWRVEGVRDLTGTAMSGVATGSFVTGTSADLVAPTLLSSTPTDLSTDNPPTGSLTMIFDEPLSPETVLDGSFVLQVDGNTRATITTLSADGMTVTATLAQPPPPFANISAWVRNDWTDLSGNPASIFIRYTLGN